MSNPKQKSELFEQLMQNETYKRLLDELPEDERKVIKEKLEEITLIFEKGLLEPLKNLKGK